MSVVLVYLMLRNIFAAIYGETFAIVAVWSKLVRTSSPVLPVQFSMIPRQSFPRRVFVPWKVLGAATAATVLTGPIEAQVIPTQATTRTWDAGAGDLLWSSPLNWSADTLPGVDDIANFNVAPATQQNINLGGMSWEIAALFFSANGASFYNLQTGTIVTNSLNQNNDDSNVLDPSALLFSKNGGLEVINASVSSNTLQLQGKVTSGGLNKFGSATLRLGTSGTSFENAINGDITIYGGTLTAAAGATPGVNNPLGGTGDIVIGNSGVTLSLTSNAGIATNVDYDFVRNIRAGNNSFTINANLAAGTDASDPNMRAGTLFIGNATATTTQGSGFRVALDAINMAAGSTTSRLHASTLTFVDGLIGDAAANLYKRGGSDLEIRGSNEATFAGDIFIGESNLRLLSTAPGFNPAGGTDSTIFFSNGYGLTAIDGGQTLQLRSDATLDYGSNIAFRPGVTIGRIDVNRVGTTATGQTLSLGDVNISGKVLRILGGNTYNLGLDTVTVDAGTSTTFDTASANVIVNSLVLGAGSTFNKIGVNNTLTLGSNNSATALGTINLKAGTITATTAGALGAMPVTVGNPVPNTAGFLTDFARLNYGVAGASANATGTDVIVLAGGAADLNATPDLTDIFDIRADGRIQGTAAQLAALSTGTNLTVAANAIIAHEQPGAVTGTVGGLANDASIFYGLAANANSVPIIGVGTPWKGLSSDNTAGRVLQGVDALTPAVISINGGDNNPATIEATFQSMNDQNFDLGTAAAGDGTYTWVSTAAGGEKVTIAIRGALGISTLGLVPGGRVILRDNATVTGLNTAVDKIVVQSGTFSVGTVNGLGGVPVEVQANGSLDIGNTAGDILDGNVTIKSGGVLFLNDNQVLGGSGVITIESGGKLDITGSAPANIFSGSTQPINFAGSGHTVRFAASNIDSLDSTVPDAGVTYVVAGGATAAILGESNASVSTNTQSAGITLNGGILTNDATSRGFVGAINLNNSNFTIAATRNTILATTSTITTTGNVQVGSDTAIDGRDKNQNPDRISGLGLPDPYNGHSEVLFLGPVTIGGSMTVANGTRVGFADPSTNVAGDLTFNGTVLYLDGGGELNSGSSTRGGLTARLTDASGIATNRVANRIILGNYARAEMSVSGAGPMTITQPFVITGQVNPIDKRTFWIDRADASGTPSVFLSDLLLKPNAQFGIDENATAVRASLKLEGNATLVRNHDDYDLRDVVKAPGAPAAITVLAGEAAQVWDDSTEYFFNGSNAVLISSIDGTIDSGITIDLIRAQLFFEQNAVLNGTVRAQTAVLRGDAFVVSRSSGLTTNTVFNGTGEIQLGRSVAANGPEDFDIRSTEVTTGNPAQTHTVAVPVRVVDDGAINIDGVVRSERNNDSNVTGLAVLNTLNVDAGATVQTISSNQTRLTINTINLGANSGIDSNNSTSVFLGNVVGGTNAIRFSGPAQARITGNITASQINVTGAGIDFDPGSGNLSTVNAPVALSGLLSVRSGTADLGSNIITGAPTQLVAGLRENKTQGSFDETTANFSNEVKLGPVLAQVVANVGWGENQTATYTGQILIPDNETAGDGMGSIAFAKWFDDSMKIVIDGVTYLRNTTFNDGVATGPISLTTGWHDIEIRLGQGGGGAGPFGQDGNAFNLGLGIDLTTPVSPQIAAGAGLVIDGSHYVNPLDNGSMNLFRTTTLKSSLSVGADATLSVGGLSNIGAVTFAGNASTINVSGAGLSDAETLSVNGTSSSTLNVAALGASVTVASSTTVPAGAILTKIGSGALTLNGAVNVDGMLQVSSGTVNFNGSGGSGVLAITGGSLNVAASASHGGSVTLDGGSLMVNGSIVGNVTATAGTVRGSGSIGGILDVTFGGNVQPGSSPGILTVGSLTADNSSTLTVEVGRLGLSAPVAGVDFDQLRVAGGVLDLGGTVGDALGMILSIVPVGTVVAGDIFTIVLNQGTDVDPGTFAGVANGALINQSGYQFKISYFDNPLTPAFETIPGSGGTSVSLLTVVPEPASALVLLAGSAMALGLRRFRRRE
jgi:fibronectin-binding autotransporter adhesin